MNILDLFRKQTPGGMKAAELKDIIGEDHFPLRILELRQKVHEQDLLIDELKREIIEIKFMDKLLRKENPALQDAWEQYQIVLQLVRSK